MVGLSNKVQAPSKTDRLLHSLRLTISIGVTMLQIEILVLGIDLRHMLRNKASRLLKETVNLITKRIIK
jgi:hypothetical protein